MNRTAHTLATVALAGALLPLDPLLAGGAAAGLLLTPDLDQSDTPYGWVRKHRGLSHWPVVGTAERCLWFAGPALAAWLWSGRAVDWEGLGLLFAGLCLSDALHWLTDRPLEKVLTILRKRDIISAWRKG